MPTSPQAMKILLDNGHGIETPGKRSPDGKFLEYQYNRIIASRVTANLVECGYDTYFGDNHPGISVITTHFG